MSEALQLAVEERRHDVLRDALLNDNVPGSAMMMMALLSIYGYCSRVEVASK